MIGKINRKNILKNKLMKVFINVGKELMRDILEEIITLIWYLII